jgi:hypothetical protein
VIDWCEIHDCEYTYSPHGYACAPCGYAANAILELVEATGLSWEAAREQYDEGFRDCEFCGYCDGHCPWRIICPTCGAKAGIGMGQCMDSEAGGRLVKLHEARWNATRA